jgi:hypothetical protein
MRRGPLLVGSIFLAMWTVVGCRDKAHGETNRMIGAAGESLDSLGKELELSFPSSAQLIGSQRLNGNDTVRLKVEMSADDLPTFLAHAPVESDAFATGSGGYLG